MHSFYIEQWYAWAPGIKEQDDWRKWLEDEYELGGDVTADVSFIPAMQRRRLTTLAKAVTHTVFNCAGEQTDIPMIFCSANGEIHRTYNILRTIASNEPVSPTEFSLAVHNSIAGLISMMMGNTAPNIALSPGEQGVINGLLEALGMLSDGDWDRVLVALYEEPLPDYYRPYVYSPALTCSLAIIIKRNADDKIAIPFTIKQVSTNGHDVHCTIFDIVRFLLDDKRLLSLSGGEYGWNWYRNI